MPSHLHLRVVEAPRREDIGQRHVMEPGTWRVVGRASAAADATVALTKAGDRVLDPDRQTLVNKAVGGTDRVRAQKSRRAPDVDLQDDGVSRTHAMVFVDLAGNASVVDLMSTNGTLLNGKDVQDADMLPGDEVRVGGTRLRLEPA